MSNPLVLPGIGAILALGAGYAWYAMRRRKKEEKFEDSLIAAEGFTANSLFGSTGGQTGVDTHASAFASSRDTGADMHSTEVDPIAEAEVYIAYGREAQAEEILKEALKKQPERQAIRLKLLEIFAGRKDAKSFAAMANEMYGMTGGQNEEWPKVVTLGLAVDPDNPLYTGKAAGDAQSFGVTPQAPEPVAFEQPLEDEPPAASARAPSHDAGVPAAVAGLGAAAMGAAAAHATQSASERAPAASSAQEDVPALDFDLDLDAAIGKATSARESAKPSDLAKAVEGKFDLPTLELPGLSATGGAHAAEAADAELGDLKIDLPALEGLETEAVEQPQAIDLSAIGLDLQPSTLAPPPSADAARWQEMATKLDLASAYEEIGDKEGARELLQEVLKGGDTDQQQKARAMLSKIS
jgi:pilus assembly protein FimV